MDHYMDFVQNLKQLRRLQSVKVGMVDPIKLWEDPCDAYSEREFKQKYRFTKWTFKNVLIPLVSSRLVLYRGESLSVEIQLLVALRFFACGAFQNTIGDTIQVSQPSVCRIVQRVARIFASMRSRFIRFPVSEREARSIKRKFCRLGGIPGVIGAIDCTHIRIIRPRNDENPELYRNRKGYFSINVQAICNQDLTFTDVVARWPGSTHDSRIFENSRIFVRLRDEVAPTGHLVGDGGYATRKFLLAPYRQPATVSEELYNKAHVKTRNPIERAFGVAKKRFSCIGSELRTSLSNTLAIIVCCFVLHNIAIQYNDHYEDEDSEEENEVDLEDNDHELPVVDGDLETAGREYRRQLTVQLFDDN